jgi:DNA-nicking Smr family endonuclease
MVKRAKAKKAKKKAPQAEPFFRPFAKIELPPAGEVEPAAARPPAPKQAAAAPPPARGARPASPEREEEPPVDPDTFALYMAGVRALPDRATRIPTTASRVERAPRGEGPTADPDLDARARMRSLVTEGIRFEVVDDGERLEGRRLDVDPRDLRRLRHGKFAVDGKLDLHGLGVAEARRAVEDFIKKRAHDGDRAVTIVHGKGTHSPRGQGVLRGEIAAWLSQGRSSRHVAAFATAPDEHGGTGALLVLLAR